MTQNHATYVLTCDDTNPPGWPGTTGLVRDEEVAGSNPVTPTAKRKVRAGSLPRDTGPDLVFWEVWRNPGEDLRIRLQDSLYFRAFSRASRAATGDPGLIARRASKASSHISVGTAMSACRIPRVMWS